VEIVAALSSLATKPTLVTMAERRRGCQRMTFGLGGTNEDGNRVWTVAPAPGRTQVVDPDKAQDKVFREELQFLGFLRIAQLTGATGTLKSSELGGDPPDLIVDIVGGQPLAVELTTLSVTDLSRQRASEIQRIASDLSARLAAEPKKYRHLRGLLVSLAEHQTDENRPKKRDKTQRAALINELAARLAVDFGVAFEFEVDASGHVPAEEAQRGIQHVDEYAITIRRAQAGIMSDVQADIQSAVDAAEVRERLLSAIDMKDRPENDVLLISVGLFDPKGYVQTADSFVYRTIGQIVADGLAFTPEHLDQVIVHWWGSGEMLVIYQRPGAPVLVDTAAGALEYWSEVPD
jgi:hypothetical protein